MWVEVAGCEGVGAERRGTDNGAQGGELGVEVGGLTEEGVERRVCFRTRMGS